MYIREFVFYFFFYSWTIIFFLFFSLVYFFSESFTSKLSYFWSKSVIKLIQYILNINYKITGYSNLSSKPVIIASNHQSAWETFFIYTLVKNPIYILKKELKKIPILSSYFKKLGFIYVDRETVFKSTKEILKQIKEKKVNNKRTIVIFPEGTRVKPGTEKNLGGGVFLLYKHLKLPIITIRHNSGNFWVNKKIKKCRGTIDVQIFPAILPGLKKHNIMNILHSNFYKI